MQGRTPKYCNLFIKNVWIYSHMFKLQSLSQYSPFDAIHLLRLFSTAQNRFWTHWFWCLLVFPLFFCFTSSILAKHFSLRIFFIWGNKKNVSHSQIRWIRRVGHGSHAIFGPKLLNTQCSVGRCADKLPITKWANVLKESSKKFTKAERSLSQQCQLVHWYRWVSRKLT